MRLKFTNFAESTLASAILAADTSITVGDASKFPALAVGEFCRLTIFDGTNVPEIVEVSAIVGNTLTVVRAKEGTSAVAWGAGAKIRLSHTAESLESLFTRLEILWGGTSTGSANALAINPDTALTAYADGQVFLFKSSASANTGAATLAVGLLSAIPIKKLDGVTALTAGDIPASTICMVVIASSTAILVQPNPQSGALSGTSLAVSGASSFNDVTVNGALSISSPANDDNSLHAATTKWVLARIVEYLAASVLDFSGTISVPNASNFSSFLHGTSTKVSLLHATVSDTVEVGSASTGAVYFVAGASSTDMYAGTDGYLRTKTAGPGDNTTKAASTAFVTAAIAAGLGSGYAPLASPTFTGTPSAPTATAGDSTTKLATTAFVATSFAPLASPTFSGTPLAPTPTAGDNTSKLATTNFVGTAITNAVNAISYVSKDMNYSNVGSFCFCSIGGNNAGAAPGGTVAGSLLKPVGISIFSTGTSLTKYEGSALTGTWRCLGKTTTTGSNETECTLYQRIS